MSRLQILPIVIVWLASNAAGEEKQRLEISGRIMFDADYYGSFWDKAGDSSTSEAEIRNARLEIEYDFPKGWEGKLQIDAEVDAGDNDVELGSTYLRYTKWDIADVTFGKMKEPAGLERTTSAGNLMTIERSMMTTAFAPGKSWGVHLRNANKKRTWALAMVVEDDQNDDYDEDVPTAISGRFVWSPINTDEQTLQIGASGSVRDWKENRFRIRERAEVGTADRVVRSVEFIADSQTLIGIEGAWRHKNLLLQAELIETRVEEVDGPDWRYNGYYLSGSYFLTGEQYRLRKGKFRKVNPETKTGAWELIVRYSYLDLRERNLGSEATVITLGVNYYLGKHVKIMLAYLHPDISGAVFHDDPDGDAISLRVQFR